MNKPIVVKDDKCQFWKSRWKVTATYPIYFINFV